MNENEKQELYKEADAMDKTFDVVRHINNAMQHLVTATDRLLYNMNTYQHKRKIEDIKATKEEK